MLMLLSPSKTQDFTSPSPVKRHSVPRFLGESEKLIAALRPLPEKKIEALMDISQKLAALNVARYRAFTTPFTPDNAKQALYAFQGDVYDGLDAASLSQKAVTFAQAHLRILSGLYGLLRPLDLIQPYRLEMKIRLKNPRGKDLYQFWGTRLTDALRGDIKAAKAKQVLNLASEEYAGAIDFGALGLPVVAPRFLEKKGSDYKMIALFAKQARGRMAGYVARHALTDAEETLSFAEDGYRYHAGLSVNQHPVFVRG